MSISKNQLLTLPSESNRNNWIYYQKTKNLISDKPLPGQIYDNILDEQLDFIGKFENLAEDCQKLKSILGVKVVMKVHTERNTRNEYQKYFNSNTPHFFW